MLNPSKKFFYFFYFLFLKKFLKFFCEGVGTHIRESPWAHDMKSSQKVKCLYYVRSNPIKNNNIHSKIVKVMAKNLNASVTIPASTLNALKGLLFNSEEGVDLNSIIKDLAVGNTNEDLVAINVGLVFKGLTPEIDTTVRYSKDYKELVQYTFVSYSMIRDLVTYERKTIAKWDSEKNDLCPVDEQPYVDTISLNGWYDKSTDRSVPTQELVKQWAKKEDKPQPAL